uniref:Ig-like domain-containing protein n=1 Tax=Branchiostoma floridae TaxID=7739 RepID=C3YI09_BRAFL|eukprot:XP_002604135.1 hypothetical protein BRAFLDRAFT_71574 [Branchiostoma floridae]
MLFLAVLCCLGILQTSDRELEVFRTNSLELRCSYDSTTSDAPYQVSWYRLNDDGSPGSAFLSSLHGKDVHVEDRQAELGLKGRVSIQPDGLSLNITDTFLHDEGIYRCEVTILHPFLETNSSDVQLSVVDYQIRGYTEGVVFSMGIPVTLTAIVSGSHLPSQNSWTVNGNRPPPNSVSEVTLKGLDGLWTVTSTLTFQGDTTVTVVFKSYIPLPRTSSRTQQPRWSEDSRTALVQMAIFFGDTRSPFAVFAAAEAGCTIAASALALILFSLHMHVEFKKSRYARWL